MTHHLFSFALALVVVHASSLVRSADFPDPEPVRVTGNSVQSYVDLRTAVSHLDASAKELLKNHSPTFDPAGIIDIRPHRFTAVYDDAVRVYEHLALWVRTVTVSSGPDPFAPIPTGKEQNPRLFLVIMTRIKYEDGEKWGIQHYHGEPPGPLFEAAVLDLTESKNSTEAADNFCREWAMLPPASTTKPAPPLRGIPQSNPHWLVNVLFVKDQ